MNVEERLQILIGRQAIRIAVLETENEALASDNARLQEALAKQAGEKIVDATQ